MAQKDTPKQVAAELENDLDGQKDDSTRVPTKKLGFFKTMFIFLFILSVMLGVALGTIYYVLKNNINNVAENNRVTFSKTPLIKYFLPEPKDKNILDAAALFSDKELRVKYEELFKERNDLRKVIADLTKNVSEKDKVTAENGQLKKDSDSVKAQSDVVKQEAEKAKIKLEEDKKAFGQMVAKADKEGFKKYFDQVDKETARKIYEEVVKQAQGDEGKKNIAKIYETMDPAASAKILEELYLTNKELVIDILKNMKKDITSQVLAAMKAATAADLSKPLEESYKPK